MSQSLRRKLYKLNESLRRQAEEEERERRHRMEDEAARNVILEPLEFIPSGVSREAEPMRSDESPKERRARILKMQNQGIKIGDIAAHEGVSIGRIKQLLKEAKKTSQ